MAHKLAILLEELRKAEYGRDQAAAGLKNPRLSGKVAGWETRIRTIKSKIDALGRRGELKVSIVKKKYWYTQPVPEPIISSFPTRQTVYKEKTEVIFWYDLDDASISQLINNGVKDNERIIEKAIIPVPLGHKLDDPNNLFISWLKG